MLFSYCTNIHPGETWPDVFASLRQHVSAVRRRVRPNPNDPFPLGLRLGATAASDLIGDKANLRAFRAWMEDENMLAFTINGFPYGAFHGTRVKEQVFLPDWSSPQRVEYTRNLFHILTEILPEGEQGSVSTVPGTLARFATENPALLPAILDNLRAFARELDELSSRTRLDLHLGLEPEPLGLIDDTPGTLGFFSMLHDGQDTATRDALNRRIGLCYDACHFAIAGEHAGEALDSLTKAGIRLSKVHLSNALALSPQDPGALDQLRGFDEPVYFHQVIADLENGSKLRFHDIPDALADPDASNAREWRVHFHIPLYADPAAPLRSTRPHLEQLAAWLRRHPGRCSHFEMETYTYAALPETLRPATVEDLLVREFQWCESHILPSLTP